MNEVIPPQATAIVLQYGLAGVVIIALAVAAWRLFTAREADRTKHETKLDAIQEQRIAEARKEVEAKLALAASLESMAEANKLIGEKYAAVEKELALLRAARGG